MVARTGRAPAELRPLRPCRPRDADRADALRAAADHHQRATSPCARCPPDVREAARGMGMTGPQQFWRVELPLGAAAGRVGPAPGARAGVGDRHHRRARRRAGARPDHHRRLLPRPTTARASPARSSSPSSRWSSSSPPRSSSGRSTRTPSGPSSGSVTDALSVTGATVTAARRIRRLTSHLRTRAALPRDTEGTTMHARRSLAAVLAAGALALLTGCAGDDLASTTTPPTTPSSSGGGDKGSVDHRRPELPRGRARRLDVRAAPRGRRLHRRDQARRLPRRLHADLPRRRRHRPRVRRRHRQLPQHPGQRRRRRALRGRRRPAARRRRRQPARGRRASRCSTSPRPPTPTPSSSPRTTPTPRASPRSPTSRARASSLAAAPDCEGRPTARAASSDDYGIDVTRCSTARLRLRPDLPVGPQRRVPARRDLHHDGTLESQGLVVLEDDKAIQPAQNLVPGGLDRLPRRPPRRRGHPQPADGGARPPRASPSSTARWPSTASQAGGRRQGVPGVRRL